VSLITDLLLATAKFMAAAFTGSSAMLSEGIHSTIDAGSQVLLIWGIRMSKKNRMTSDRSDTAGSYISGPLLFR